MSSVGGGAVVGLGAVAIGICAAAVPVLAALVATTTVLVAKGTAVAAVSVGKGMVFVGKKLRQAYEEHGRRVEERLRREAEIKAHVAGLMRELSEGLDRPLSGSEGAGAVRDAAVRRVKARALNRVAEQRDLERELLAEVEEVVSRLRADGAETSRPGAAAQKGDALLRAPPTGDASEFAIPALDQAARRRVDAAIREEMLVEIDRVLRFLPDRGDLRERLTGVRGSGGLAETEALLEEAHAVRRALSQRAEGAIDLQGFEDRVLALRLAAQFLRPLAEAERAQFRRAAEKIEQLAASGRVSEAERQLKDHEAKVAHFRQRDIDAWIREENAAEEALLLVRARLVEIEEDEGKRIAIEALGRSAALGSLGKELGALGAAFASGGFSTVTRLATGVRERLERLQKDSLEAIQGANVQAIVQVVQKAMETRGFGGVEVKGGSGGYELTARRGETPLWVQVDKEGRVAFDLGKQGFESQQACFGEIDALLKQLVGYGMAVELGRKDGTFAPGEQVQAARPVEPEVQVVTSEPQRVRELDG